MEAILESALPWIIGTGVGGLLLGGWIGLVMGRSRGNEHEIERLTAELAQAETALETYRTEVYEEFAETAVKFKALNDSYTGLHEQLARSAAVLCGEPVANALLEGPEQQALESSEAETVEDDASVDTVEPIEDVASASDTRQAADDDVTSPEDLGEILVQESDINAAASSSSSPEGTEVPTLDEVVEELGEVAQDLRSDLDDKIETPVKKTG